jgi:hypothetical protein
MNSGMAFLGLLLGAGANVGLYLGIGISFWLMGIVIIESIVFYLIARFTSRNLFGEVMRGWLIGMNAALNCIFAFRLCKLFMGMPAPIIIGIVLGVWNGLTVFSPISKSEIFQGFFGWLIWISPMSWLIIALGLAFYIINLVFALFTGFSVEYLKIKGLKADWKTGTFFMKGGLIGNLNPLDTAFNMGNFSFVDKASSNWHISHEAGHTLNLGAFGSLFHLIGAIDENIFRAMRNAYAERLAESNNSTGGSVIPMWA